MESEASDDPSPLRGLFALVRAGVLLALVLVYCGAHAQVQKELDKFREWNFQTRPVTEADVRGMSLRSLELLRGIVFGKHGRIFREPAIQNYLAGQKWYEEDLDFSNASLNDVERRSIDLIRGAEARMHPTVQPGDLRFWASKAITKRDLGRPSLLDTHIMACEIEAIHGKRFAAEPAMQSYFEERYWYKPASKYDPKSLGPIERQNLMLLQRFEQERRKAGIGRNDMALFDRKPLQPRDLRNVGLFDLRILRNEIYARRGYVFKTAWLADWFAEEDWYDPDATKQVSLTKIDRHNLGVILAREKELHEALTNRRLTAAEIGTQFVEDLRKLRNEIYARHGKVFKAKWLQGYFASLPWYKPNPRYSDALLSATERHNLKILSGLEKTAASLMRAAEG